mgnify:FL=1
MPKKSESGKKSVEEKKEKIASKKISAPEFEKMVLDLAEQNLTSEKIGEALRKQGIHPKEHGKKISGILKEKGKYTNPDIKNVEKNLEKVLKHIEKNKQDKKAVREKDRIFAQLRILKKHFQVQ